MDVLHYLENQSIRIKKRINLARNCLKIAEKGHSISIQGTFDWLCHQYLNEGVDSESKKDTLEIICQLIKSLTEKNSDVRLILQTSAMEALIKNLENDGANLQMAVLLNALFDHLSILRCIIRDEAYLLKLIATILRCYDGLSAEPEYFRLLGRLGFQLQEKNRLSPSLSLLQNFVTTVLPPAVDLLLCKSQAVNVTEAKNRWKVVVQNFLFASNFYDDWKNFLHSIPGLTQTLPYYPDTIDCVIKGVRSEMNDKQKCVFMTEVLVDGFLRRYKKSQTEAFVFMAVLLAMLGLHPEAKDEPAVVVKDSEAALSLKLEQMPDPETKVECVLRMLAVLKEKEYSIMTELNSFRFVNWLQNLLQLLMKDYGKSVPKVMKVCESLMDINPATIQYVPGPIIKSVLTNRTQVNAQECDSLLTAILQAFVKLRDVPKFLQLLLQAARLLKVDAGFVGKQFLDSFENVVTYELISTQVIGLWGLVLVALEKEMDSGDLELCDPPFLLLHSIIMSGRLVEHTLPDVQFHEIAALTTRTRRILERAVEKGYRDQEANYGFLKLVFAFNEFHSLLMRYAEVYRKAFEAQHMQVDGEEIRGLVRLPLKTQNTQHPELWNEIHLQSLRLHGNQHLDDEQPIESPSFYFQFVHLCENSTSSHCLNLTKRLIDGAMSDSSDLSKLLDVNEVVDARKIQLGVLLNCFYTTKTSASRWVTLCKAVRDSEEIWFSTKDKEIKEKLKELVELVSSDYLEYLDEDSETLKDLSPIFDILLKFPIDSFAHSDMVLLLCYLFAAMSSTNDRAALEKAFCLLAITLENPEKVPPLFKYFDANIVIPWVVEKMKGLTDSKVVKPVLEVVVDVVTRTSGCLEGFIGFSKEEQNDVTRLASVVFLENLKKSRKRLKKSPKLNYIDNLLKSVIKSFQKSLKASPALRPDLENPNKNTALLSACSCVLQIHQEAKLSTTLKVKTVLKRIPKILQVAYEGVKSDNENWADSSRQFIELVLKNRNDLAANLPGDLVVKVWEAYKASTVDERWKDGTVRKICSVVKKTELARISEDILEGLKSAVCSSNLKLLEKYSGFLRQLMQAQVPDKGPRAHCRKHDLHGAFSLLSSSQFSWPEGNDAIEASCVVMENFRVLLTSQQILLNPVQLALGLDCVINAPFEESVTLKNFISVFMASFKILHALLTRHEELSADRMSTLIRCFSILLSVAVSRFHQGKNLGDEDLKAGLICSEKLGGLASVMADQKLRYRRVAPYVIAEILEQFQKFTLYPAFREQLTHGVYSLMSVLDKHAVSQLMATLPSGSREVFKMEYETFQKYHKYTGKV